MHFIEQKGVISFKNLLTNIPKVPVNDNESWVKIMAVMVKKQAIS